MQWVWAGMIKIKQLVLFNVAKAQIMIKTKNISGGNL